jgi:lipopolysaccharide transport system ATP-binding protein
MICDLNQNEILSVQHVSKIYTRKHVAERGMFTSLLQQLFGGKKMYIEEKGTHLIALSNINFSLKKGEVLGIIGPNGAGKSTLLKIMSGITVPTQGRVLSRGRTISILKIGTGFHPEISCRENIFITGELYGMTRAEIKQQFNHIVDFSGIGDFLDTPVKHFSDGMFLRLAFSLAFHAKVELMLLDEVIGVGDAEFQLKAQQHIQKMIEAGTSLVLTSHNLVYIMQYCHKVILINHGMIEKTGSPVEVIESYLRMAWSVQPGPVAGQEQQSLRKEGQFELVLVHVKATTKKNSEPILANDAIEICFRLTKEQDDGHLSIAIMLYDIAGKQVTVDAPSFRDNFISDAMPSGKYQIKAVFPKGIFNRGIFRLQVIVVQNGLIPIAQLADAAVFQVHAVETPEHSHKYKSEAPFRIPMQWNCEPYL